MVRKMVTTTRTIARIIGPYNGQRISGTSNNMLEVIITITYNFDGFLIAVADVPAQLDREKERYYLSGPVAIRLNDKVNEIVVETQRKQQTEPETVQRDTSLMIELTATDFLSDAA